MSGDGLNGIRLILAGMSPSNFASARACAGLSLTPASSTYSKVMRVRGRAAAYRRQAASNSAIGYFLLSGTSCSRNASSGACNDTAKLTGQTDAKRSMAGTKPAVLSVTRRFDNPNAQSSSMRRSAATTASKFNSGSPMPMRTMLVMAVLVLVSPVPWSPSPSPGSPSTPSPSMSRSPWSPSTPSPSPSQSPANSPAATHTWPMISSTVRLRL